MDYARMKALRFALGGAICWAATLGINAHDKSTSYVDTVQVQELTQRRDAIYDSLTPDQRVLEDLAVTDEELVSAGISPELMQQFGNLRTVEEELAREERGDSNLLMVGAMGTTFLAAVGFGGAAVRTLFKAAVQYPRRDDTET